MLASQHVSIFHPRLAPRTGLGPQLLKYAKRSAAECRKLPQRKVYAPTGTQTSLTLLRLGLRVRHDVAKHNDPLRCSCCSFVDDVLVSDHCVRDLFHYLGLLGRLTSFLVSPPLSPRLAVALPVGGIKNHYAPWTSTIFQLSLPNRGLASALANHIIPNATSIHSLSTTSWRRTTVLNHKLRLSSWP